VLTELPERHFALTPVGELLRSDVPGSMRAMLRMIANGEHFNAWSKLGEAVRTGGIATDLAEGKDIWAYYRDNPDRSVLFNDAMTCFSALSDRIIAEAFPFGDFQTVCDFGGGHGGQLISILETYPKLKGIVYDLEYVVAGARENFARHGVEGRAEAIGGSFFEAMAPGADVYIAKNIIHDWDDEKSIQILRNVRKVIPAHGRLILLEITVAGPNIPDPGKFMDVNMLAMTGGKERTSEEFAALYTASGFRLLEVRPTKTPVHLVIGEVA
jgi:hypothetical protein